MKVHGSCHCRRVTYEAEVDPELAGICNCSDCQMLSGSVFRVSVPAASDRFRLLSGELTRYIKTADSGTKRCHAFCPNCGAPVFSCAATEAPPLYSLRIGCLQERADLPPKQQIWCSSALPWLRSLVDLPGRAGQ